jgi:hypothetical protein
MYNTPSDISSIRDAVEEALRAVLDRHDEREEVSGQVTPPLLAQATRQLLDVLQRIDSGPLEPQAEDRPLERTDISELGDYGMSLLADLASWARRLGLTEVQQRLNELSLPLALWVARHGGELRALEPVVNSLAALANRTTAPAELEALHGLLREIADAAAPAIRQDLEKGNPSRPWRILNLNRGIVATRTLNPRVMEAAFRELVQNLPEDAPEFFREAMVQMEALRYPPQVREVVEKYYKQWSDEQTLH